MKMIGALLLITACRVTQRQEIGGEASAKLSIEYPQADRCFTDPRIETFDQLKQCLELTTNNKWTISADGQIVPVLADVANGGQNQ